MCCVCGRTLSLNTAQDNKVITHSFFLLVLQLWKCVSIVLYARLRLNGCSIRTRDLSLKNACLSQDGSLCYTMMHRLLPSNIVRQRLLGKRVASTWWDCQPHLKNVGSMLNTKSVNIIEKQFKAKCFSVRLVACAQDSTWVWQKVVDLCSTHLARPGLGVL